MKSYKVGWALTLLACSPNSSGSTDQVIAPPADVTLKVGTTRNVGGVEIGFMQVKEDSRCPSDVQCVWAGNAAVELSLASGGAPAVTRVVNSTLDPKTVEEYGMRITFKALSPAPRQTAPDTTTPTVVLHVEKP